MQPDIVTDKPKWSGLQARIASAIVMASLLLSAELLGGIWFTALILLAALIMIREWDGLTELESDSWKWAGFAYVGLPCLSLIWLRGVATEAHPDAGMALVLYLMFIVWGTDTGAYFTGKHIGGPKLIPSISPNKTWAGLIGGMITAAIIGALCTNFSPYPTTALGGALVGMLLAVVGQAGDFFESWLKRRAGVKDSGTLIPGHGGLLDRVDGLVTASPVFALLVAMGI